MGSNQTTDQRVNNKEKVEARLRKDPKEERDYQIERNLRQGKEKTGDYSFERVPRSERNMGWFGITNITFGIATAIFYFQMGSVMALQFGAINALISSLYAIVVAGILGSFIVYLSAKSGMNVNLLSRGGFGYVGAALTSLIYASNFIMYCAFEGMILVAAVHAYFPSIPVWLLIVVFGSIIIPLNWFGIKQLDKLQKWSLPIFFVFLMAAVALTFQYSSPFDANIWTFLPNGVQVGGTALLLCMGMHHGIMGLTALIASDYARFLKPKDLKIGSIVIGFVPQVFCYGVMGALGIWFGVTFGETNPGVYIVILLGLGGVLFTLLTQIRINVTNIYSSSLSLSNFFENTFNFTPGRRFWIVVAGVSAMILMLGGIVDHLDIAMTFQGVALMSWAAVLVTDALILRKWLKIAPGFYESRQERLFKWNPVGVVSLIIPTVLGTIAALGYMGLFLQSTAAIFAALMAVILTVVLGIATKGRYYTKIVGTDVPKEDYIG